MTVSCNISMKENRVEGDTNKKTRRYVEYYDSGTIKAIGNYRNGLKKGLFTFFRENGTLKEINEYENDTIVNTALFNEESYCYESTHEPFLESYSQEVPKGKSYPFELGFKGKPIGKLEVVIEKYNPVEKGIDTVKVLHSESGHTVKYMVAPEADSLRGAIIDRIRVELDSGILDLQIPFGFDIELVGND